MSIATVLLILVAVILVIFLVKRTATAGKQRPNERAKPVSHESTQYHAVSIKLASNACDAARAMAGRRFLSNAAPRIPLADCDAEKCNCRFVHHKDRRGDEDRRDTFGANFGGAATSGSKDEERRRSRERREDLPEDFYE